MPLSITHGRFQKVETGMINSNTKTCQSKYTRKGIFLLFFLMISPEAYNVAFIKICGYCAWLEKEY